jgi:hypothetical protein
MADFTPLVNLLRALLLWQCSVCKRRNLPTNPDVGDWMIQTNGSILLGTKCPDCQTPEERANCVIEQVIGAKFRFEGLRLVELPQPPEGPDEGNQAQAS